MFKCVFEKHQTHVGIDFVVFVKSFSYKGFEFPFLVGHLVVDSVSSDSLREVTVDQGFGIVLGEVSLEVELSSERLFDDVEKDFPQSLHVFNGNESVSVGSFDFVNPKFK